MEQAEVQYKKREKKEAPAGWDVFNQRALYQAYLKRSDKVPYTQEDYEAAKAKDPDFYRCAGGGGGGNRRRGGQAWGRAGLIEPFWPSCRGFFGEWLCR